MDTRPTPQYESRRVWFAFIGSAIAWFVHFTAVWFISEEGCLLGLGDQTIFGMNLIFGLSMIVTLITLLIAIASGTMAYRIWQQARDLEEENEVYASHARQRFMGIFGMVAALIFIAAIILETVPLFVVSIC